LNQTQNSYFQKSTRKSVSTDHLDRPLQGILYTELPCCQSVISAIYI